jgi:hypothetical protein
VPVAGVAAGGLALASHSPVDAVAIAAAGAAIAAAARALLGGSAAATCAVAIAALLGALGLLALPGVALVRAAAACAAGAFACAELVRPMTPDGSPWPAIGAAVLAGALDPSFAALLAIAGVRLVRGPWPRPRAALAVPCIGALAIALAALGVAHGGAWWAAWADRAAHPLDAARAATRIGDALGPITAVAALAGLVLAAARGRYVAATLLAVAAGALAADVRAAAAGPATIALAALAAGVAIGRLAGMIRWPVAQACVAAAAGALVLVAPAWLVLG